MLYPTELRARKGISFKNNEGIGATQALYGWLLSAHLNQFQNVVPERRIFEFDYSLYGIPEYTL